MIYNSTSLDASVKPYKEPNIFQKASHHVINNTSNFLKENKVGIATTIVSGGTGAIKGAATKTGLHFSKKTAQKETRELITKGAINGAKGGFLASVVASKPIQAFLDPDSLFSDTTIGKKMINPLITAPITYTN